MKQIAAALLKSQKEMGNAIKGSKNPFFKSKYADLNAIREAVLPVLNANGIVVLQQIQVQLTGGPAVETHLLHESGESINSFTPIVCSKPNDPQALGSAISYARRYGLQSMVCLGAEDDDGENAMGRKAENPPILKAVPATTTFYGEALTLSKGLVENKKATKDAVVQLIFKQGGNDKGPISECLKTLRPEGLQNLLTELRKLNG